MKFSELTLLNLCRDLSSSQTISGAVCQFSFSTRDLSGPLRASHLYRINQNILSFFVPDDQLRNDVVIAIEEAVSNILQHSYATHQEVYISFDFILQAFQLTISIEDWGVNGTCLETNWQTAPTPQEHLKDRAVQTRGGMGLYLIQKVMDQVQYQTTSDHCNRMILTKRLEAV